MANLATRSQTLDRGLTVLEIVSGSRTPLAISQVATKTGLHRSIVYRLIRTLEDHGLVHRNHDDKFVPGFGLVSLGASISGALSAFATPPLSKLADSAGVTAFVSVRDGDEAVTMLAIEPTRPRVALATPTAKVGCRSSIGAGAPGHALRSFDMATPHEHPAVRHARERGWTRTCGEVMDGVSCIAVPLAGYQVPAAVAVAYVGDRATEPLVDALRAVAARISTLLATGGVPPMPL